ncbi:uncharacterized protein LOC124341343 [Daphnia pulicaria]|uniref:uncharacterized protein LOC124341343 n=1 Tax=Daphnia pulicaria TaxID=35523 RepID=UPI001EEB78BB|nr:uncharacterized protein LOC124341343 [Daphnia pulicaria]
MRLALSVLVVLLAYVSAQDQQPQYIVYRNPYQAPYYGDAVINPEDPRFFRPTTTTTTTSTSTVTCTKSTAACGGRRRRELLFAGEEEEQFPIVPTAVKGVEPTQLSSRDARAADPQQVYVVPPQFAYQPQSGFQSGPYNYHPVVLPFYGSQYQPAQRLFFNQIQSALTVTKTSTVFAITTSTSTPACSVAGTIPQCPNA